MPRSVEWQLLRTDTECREEGRTTEEVTWFDYSPGDSSMPEHVEFTRHWGSATLTVTRWGLPDDATSAVRATYHLEDQPNGGLEVADCSYENACSRTPLGLGGAACP